VEWNHLAQDRVQLRAGRKPQVPNYAEYLESIGTHIDPCMTNFGSGLNLYRDIFVSFNGVMFDISDNSAFAVRYMSRMHLHVQQTETVLSHDNVRAAAFITVATR
jgi:hypothetical protein